MAKAVPGKEEFEETIRYFDTMLKKHGVQVCGLAICSAESVFRRAAIKLIKFNFLFLDFKNNVG